jgi:hypothetical protein
MWTQTQIKRRSSYLYLLLAWLLPPKQFCYEKIFSTYVCSYAVLRIRIGFIGNPDTDLDPDPRF